MLNEPEPEIKEQPKVAYSEVVELEYTPPLYSTARGTVRRIRWTPQFNDVDDEGNALSHSFGYPMVLSRRRERQQSPRVTFRLPENASSTNLREEEERILNRAQRALHGLLDDEILASQIAKKLAFSALNSGEEQYRNIVTAELGERYLDTMVGILRDERGTVSESGFKNQDHAKLSYQTELLGFSSKSGSNGNYSFFSSHTPSSLNHPPDVPKVVPGDVWVHVNNKEGTTQYWVRVQRTWTSYSDCTEPFSHPLFNDRILSVKDKRPKWILKVSKQTVETRRSKRAKSAGI